LEETLLAEDFLLGTKDTLKKKRVFSLSTYIRFAFITLMRSSMKVMPPIFFSGNVTAIKLKFTWTIHTTFAIMRLFFHKVSVIFNTHCQR
jgi:hypothetical protein